MLTEAQKTDIRRHTGYPMKGDQPSQMFGYRFMTWYGTLEYRMLHFSDEEEAVIIKMVDDCNTLESAVVGAGSNLDTNKAAVWERNPQEVADRRKLYRWSRIKLTTFMGLPAGPALGNFGERTI